MTAEALNWMGFEDSIQEFVIGSPSINLNQRDCTGISTSTYPILLWVFDRTAIGKVTNPYEELIQSAFQQVSNASFLTIDEEFQEEIDQIMAKQYAATTSQPI